MALLPVASTAVARLGESALAAATSVNPETTSGVVTAVCCAIGVGYAVGSSWSKRRRLNEEVCEVKQQNGRLQTEMAQLRGCVEQMQSQMSVMCSHLGGVQHEVGSVQGQMDGMQHQVGGVQGTVQGVHGDVAQMRGQLGGVQHMMDRQVGGLQEQVGQVRTQVEHLSESAEQNAESVQRLRGDTKQLAVRMGQSVRQALSDSLDTVVGNVNEALEQRRFGMGPRVQDVHVAVVPGATPALQEGSW